MNGARFYLLTAASVLVAQTQQYYLSLGTRPSGFNCSVIDNFYYCNHRGGDLGLLDNLRANGTVTAYEPDYVAGIAQQQQQQQYDERDMPRYLAADNTSSSMAIRCYAERAWHLDNIRPPQFCVPDDAGAGQTVYVVDTYVDVAHKNFQGRARRGFSNIEGINNFHGTHVAGLVGSAAYGSCKRCAIIAVQVLNGDGRAPYSQIIAGLAWVGAQSRRGVVTLSLSGPKSSILNHALKVLHYRKGFRVVAAAGNSGGNACNESPASCNIATVVGAYGKTQRRSDFSNEGSCVTLFAPGEVVASLLPNNQYGYSSGTSMAAPIVAGIMASTRQNRQAMLQVSSRGTVSNLRLSSSPNRAARLVFDAAPRQALKASLVFQ